MQASEPNKITEGPKEQHGKKNKHTQGVEMKLKATGGHVGDHGRPRKDAGGNGGLKQTNTNIKWFVHLLKMTRYLRRCLFSFYYFSKTNTLIQSFMYVL